MRKIKDENSPNEWQSHSFKNAKIGRFSQRFEIPLKRNHGGYGNEWT